MRDLLDAGVPVGLGVDGAASQEAGQLGAELRQALYAARLRGGPAALTAREALRAGHHGRRPLPRPRRTRSARIEPGKLADLALWRLDGLGHAGIDDPVAALVFGPPAAAGAARWSAAGPSCEHGELRTVDDRDAGPRAPGGPHRAADAEGPR